MHETPASAGWGPCTFPAWSRAGARPAQTVRTERGPSIPHRLRAASRAADVGSHGYRLSLQTGRQGSEVAHGDAKCVGCRENRSGCRISAWGRRRAGHRHGGRSAGETSDTTDAPRGGLHGHTSDVADVPRRCRYPDRRYRRPPAAPAGPRSAMSRMPKEPESRRNPGESARAAPSLVRHAGPPAGEPVHAMRAGEGRASRRSSKTEGTREPRQSWRLRAGGAANEPCLAGMCHGSGAPRSSTFSGCGLTSAEAQPLSAPAVRPWTR